MATGTDHVKANDGDSWVVVATNDAYVGGRCLEGTGELYFGAAASPPTKDSVGVLILAGEFFNYSMGTANGLWVRSGGVLELAVHRRAS